MNQSLSTRAALLARTSLAATMTLTSMLVPAGPILASEKTETPIQHIIIIVGENRTFDHLFATYKPTQGEHVRNLLSRGIVTEEGKSGPSYARAEQRIASATSRFEIAPTHVGDYETLPTPLAGGPTAPSDTSPPPYATVAAVARDQSLLHSGLAPEDYPLLTTGATGLPPSLTVS